MFTEEFEGGTNGAVLTTGNTAFTAVVGEPVFDSSQQAFGTYSARFGTGASQSVQESFTATGVRYFRRYLRLAALPSTATIIATAKSGSSTTRAQVRVMTTGDLQLRNGVTAVTATATTLAANTWYRYEWGLDLNNSTQTLRLFAGADLNGTTPTETITGTYDTGTFDLILDGQITAADVYFYEDAFASDVNWPGPKVSAGPQTLTPTGIDPAETFGAATLARGAVTVAPAGTVTAETVAVAAIAHPIAELVDEFTGTEIDTTRWALLGG